MRLTAWDRKTDVLIANTMVSVVLMPGWMVLPMEEDLQKDRYREERKEGEK